VPKVTSVPCGGIAADYKPNMKQSFRRLPVLGLILAALFCLLSCGLEEFSYIDYIPERNYENVNRATVKLPSSSDEGYGSGSFFINFIIYYRIYIAGATPFPLGTVAPTEMGQLNTALSADWNNFLSLTDTTSTSVSTSNLENTFNTRRYYKLELQTMAGGSAHIDSVLGNGSLGKTITIDFPSQPGSDSKPTLRLNNETQYVLLRADRSQSIQFKPLPENRYFQNHEDLYNSENAYSSSNPNPTVNADTISRTATTENPSQNTYVSMYIAAAGINRQIAAVYSQPTFLGIFRLPNSFF
jgi:hypothetical protein